jgi:hypothetical protein
MFEVFKAEVPTKAHTVKSKYPFAQMTSGTAFTVPGEHYAAKRNYSGGCAAVSAAYNFQNRYGGRFQSRRNTDDSITIYCVEAPSI